jgi:hypothetical protein
MNGTIRRRAALGAAALAVVTGAGLVAADPAHVQATPPRWSGH